MILTIGKAMSNFFPSNLYDQNTFYKAFEKDLKRARTSILIESPYITLKRTNELLPQLRKARGRGIQVIVNTRCPAEHEIDMAAQSTLTVSELQMIGVTVLYTGKLHRKLAIIDEEILWEGSLNIFSQSDSSEIMRRIVSNDLAYQTKRFIGVDKLFGIG